MTTTAAAPAANMASLYAALARAIGRADAVEKTARNNFHNYKYASAEGLIGEARGALSAEGLCVFPRTWRLRTFDIQDDRQGPRGYFADVEVIYVVAHSDGASLECEVITPVICEKGRPEDKALAGALTYSLGYFLRGLLLLPRVDEEHDVDTRDDREYQPRGGRGGDQRQQRPEDTRGGTGKLPQQPPASSAKPAGAPSFDLPAVLASIARAATREGAIAAGAAAGAAAQPEGVRNQIKAAINARSEELARAVTPPAAPAPAPTEDPGWARFLAAIQKATGEITDGWTEGDALIAWGAALEFAPDRKQLADLCLPWLAAASKFTGPIVDGLRARLNDEYKARRANLPEVAPATNTGAAA